MRARGAGATRGSSSQKLDRERVGIYIGITEHGNVETENQIHEVAQYDFDLAYWSHHHNPRTVANNPAGEATPEPRRRRAGLQRSAAPARRGTSG